MNTDIKQKEKNIDKMLTEMEIKVEAALNSFSPNFCCPPDHALIIQFNHERNHRIPPRAVGVMGRSILSRSYQIPAKQKNRNFGRTDQINGI